MGIQFLSRAEYCKLADLPVEQYSILRRRDQLPSVPNLDLPAKEANKRGFEAAGALYLIIATELVDRFEISRESAARIAAYGRNAFDRWQEISATSAQVANGKEPSSEVLLALIDWPGLTKERARGRPPQKVAIGTLREIADQYADARNMIAVSLTRSAALMRQRAAKARINLDAFWEA
jgi:hypothetical protein